MYRSLFSRDLFSEFDRLQRDMSSLFDASPAIRGLGRGGYPALNIGSTPQSVEIFAFAPGLDPAAIEVGLDRGVLTLSGERKATQANGGGGDAKTTRHLDERFAGRFRRVVSLPDDIDPDAVSARYSDGVLHISVKRRESTLPRRISVQ